MQVKRKRFVRFFFLLLQVVVATPQPFDPISAHNFWIKDDFRRSCLVAAVAIV
jgi:hypothetical protein